MTGSHRRPGEKRILVLGGTGHIGAAIVRELDAEGYEVTASGSRPGPRISLEGCRAAIVAGDDRDPKTLEAWIGGSDIVIDAATPYPLSAFGHRGQPSAVFVATARAGALVAAVRRAGAGLVHISSFTTLPAERRIGAQVQDAILQGLHPYFEVKRKVENRVADALRSGVDGCILNPSACFGPYDTKPRDMCFIPMLLTGKVPVLARHNINIIDVRDVARAVAAVIAAGLPHRRVPLSGHNVPIDTLAGKVCRHGGVRPPALRGSALLGAAGLYWMETALAMTGHKSPWPSLPMLLAAASHAMPPSSEQSALGIAPRPLDETLKDAIDWYRSIGYC